VHFVPAYVVQVQRLSCCANRTTGQAFVIVWCELVRRLESQLTAFDGSALQAIAENSSAAAIISAFISFSPSPDETVINATYYAHRTGILNSPLPSHIHRFSDYHGSRGSRAFCPLKHPVLQDASHIYCRSGELAMHAWVVKPQDHSNKTIRRR
jgi:hypothetical protein